MPGTRYFYAPASAEILEKTRRLEAICQRYNTPLPAANLQFLLADPLVAALIPGALTPEQVQSNATLLAHPIPSKLWLRSNRLGCYMKMRQHPKRHQEVTFAWLQNRQLGHNSNSN